MISENSQRGNTNNRVTGIIVTFNPDAEQLRNLISAILPQLDQLLIVDNCSHENLASILEGRTNIELIVLSQNFGIAKAQNIGIERARILGSNYVLLLDQDSIPAPDMVGELLNVAKTLVAKGVSIAGIGPCYMDPRQGEAAAFVYLDGYRLRRREKPDRDEFVETDFLIASGCLTPIETFTAIGMMEEAMFIDYVDIEWGLRARQQKYYCFGAFNAKMTHSLGDEWKEFRGRRIPLHSPLRHYYHFRNAIWLCRRPWLSFSWKIVLIWRLFRQYLFFTFLVPQGFSHAKMMTLGLWHGIINRMGRK
ncbi:glycosyltransferase family 2 protein [Brucella pseudintermedia]|uniref:Glycosyltransferase family 2 protein n=1 Tax=Brucella pseudintermedia TaxID=370111 RepID=A0ABY5UD05_9HYPH|nr:glycosyltransferase family 2 protein [Brucella pseudintermedia]UWL60242.1 glycosyltransferase family 2 protein [Brucella pseudintermedia]